MLVVFLALLSSIQTASFWSCNNETLNCQRSRNNKDYPSENECLLRCITKSGPGATKTLWPHPQAITVHSSNRVKVDVANAELTDDSNSDLKEMFKAAVITGYSNISSGIPLKVTVNVTDLVTELHQLPDESYVLHAKKSQIPKVDDANDMIDTMQVTINATTKYGARHAFQTLSQLMLKEGETMLMNEEVKIEDRPVFPWRGVSVDTSRNYISSDTLQKIIIGLGAAKMNVLHWHLTDSHSFPFKSKTRDLMSEYGAYSPDLVYDEDKIKQLVTFARTYGVRVIPELDTPAHSGYGYDWGPDEGLGDLVVCLNEQPFAEYCYEPPCGQMNVANSRLYDVLKDIFSDLVEAFSPESVFHLGGDEVKAKCWNTSSEIRTYMKSKGWSLDEDGFMKLWYEFQTKAVKLLREVKGVNTGEKIQVIMWSSSLTDSKNIKYLNQSDVDYIIQYWASLTNEDDKKKLYSLFKSGRKLIMSNYDDLYLDCGFSNWVQGSGNNWCSPFKPWHGIYLRNYVEWFKENFKVSEDMVKKVMLGAEAAIWTEQAGDSSILTRVFPRTWALAERLWSNPPSTSNMSSTEFGSWREAEGRLLHLQHVMAQRLVEGSSLPSDVIKPQWCRLHQGECYTPPKTDKEDKEVIDGKATKSTLSCVVVVVAVIICNINYIL